MHRTDAPGHVANQFSPGDPQNGVEPTQIDADWLNAVQNNIARVIEYAGIALAKGNNEQLRLAITNLIAASDLSAATILARLLTVDGSGCALDADLVDGFHGTDMLRRHVDFWQTSLDNVRRLFFQNGGQTYFGSGSGWSFQRDNVDRAWIDANGLLYLRGAIARISDDPNLALFMSGNTAVLSVDQDDFYFYDRVSDGHNFSIGLVTRFYVSSDGYGNAQVGFRAGGNVVWHAGNDGAGSGSDADLLDGQHGAYYADIPARLGYTPVNAAAFQKGSNANGRWRSGPDGYVEQWGKLTGPWATEVVISVTFPVEYATTPPLESILLTPVVNGTGNLQDLWCQVVAPSVGTAGFNIKLQGATTVDHLLQAVTWRCLHDNS